MLPKLNPDPNIQVDVQENRILPRYARPLGLQHLDRGEH
jgi:hypothetical protein